MTKIMFLKKDYNDDDLYLEHFLTLTTLSWSLIMGQEPVHI